jgi:hypothetical protein
MNYIGKVFNELTVLEYVKRPEGKKYSSWNTPNWVRCKCSCGNIIDLPIYGVVNNKIKSCGCLKSKNGIIRSKNLHKKGILLTYNNETHNLIEWSKITNISYSTIKYRYNKGMPPNKILEV